MPFRPEISGSHEAAELLLPFLLILLSTFGAAEHVFFAVYRLGVSRKHTLVARYLYAALFTLDEFGHFRSASFF